MRGGAQRHSRTMAAAVLRPARAGVEGAGVCAGVRLIGALRGRVMFYVVTAREACGAGPPPEARERADVVS